jgi:hypothetical protein
MKKICLTIAIAVYLLVCSNEIPGQNVPSKIDQPKLMQQYSGTWKAYLGKDTSEIWECRHFGEASIINVYRVIKKQKTPLYINNIAFDPIEGNFKGFVLWPNGEYSTWIGLFTSEKKFTGNLVEDFNHDKAFIKLENVFENSKEWTYTQTRKDGVKILEYKFKKVK